MGLDVVEGMQFDRGYLSPYFATNQENMTTELENPYILIADKKISNIRELLPLLENMSKTGKPLLIIAEDIEGDALTTLVVNNIRGIIKVAAVKAPGFGDRRKEMLEDIAVLTGSTVISEEVGLNIEKTTIDHLGISEKIQITKDNTTIINGNGQKSRINARVSQIRKQINESTSDYDVEKLQERLAKLAGGVAVIRVGAITEVEMKEKKDRIDDALNATRAAVEEGIVPGGGIALLRVIESIVNLKGENEDQDYGINIMIHAMEIPLRQIVKNAGGEDSVVLNKVRLHKSNYGYNASNESYGDMINMGILDPTKVTRSALQNASSIAGLMITTEAMICEEQETKNTNQVKNQKFGNMPM